MVLFIVRIYRLYQSLKIRRSVMTPMLLAGVFTALSGITELFKSHLAEISEIGEVVHELVTFLAVVFFFYGIFGYHQMLGKTEKPH